jgi:hypothetical protein
MKQTTETHTLWFTLPTRVRLCIMAEYFYGSYSRSPKVEQAHQDLDYNKLLH